MGWIAHSVVDGALGIGLLIAGVHGSGADYVVLDCAGGYLLVVTLVTNGPGGLWRKIPRAVHRVLDAVVAVVLIFSPLAEWRLHVHIDLFAAAMAEAVGVILLRDAAVSDHRLAARATLLASGPLIEARAFEPGERDRSPGRNVPGVARRLGRASAGVASQIPGTARRAGVVAGRAKRAGRAARAARRGEGPPSR
ncbi:MAG: hypothetical protein ACYCSF_12535 [Acidimicrobiales bacterium]